jgi:hypothetical protein
VKKEQNQKVKSNLDAIRKRCQRIQVKKINSDAMAFMSDCESCWQNSRALTRLRLLQVSPSGINRLLDGGFPTLPILLALAKAGNVSVEWLSTGQEVQSNKQELVTPPSNMAVDVKGNDVDLSEFVFVPRYNVSALQGTVHGTMKRHQCLQSVSADIGSSIT